MSGVQHADVPAAPGASRGSDGDIPRTVPWWRHFAVIVALALLTRIGFYFAGLVAMLLMLTDLRRHPYTRLGGTIVIGWWTFAWARASVPPLLGLALLSAAAAAFAVAAWQQRDAIWSAAGNAALAIVAAALALLNVVPHGTKSPTISKSDALARAVAASPQDVRATHAQVVRTRERFDQRPVYLVLLFELNPRAATTRDGEPCFLREEVHVVDGLTGSVNRRRFIDTLLLAPDRYQLAQAREKDGNCLPLPRGTHRDIVPVPSR